MLRLNVHVKRTIPGAQDYSSRSVCVGLEAECSESLIHSSADLQRKIGALLDEVDEAVLLRLQQDRPTDPNDELRSHAVNGNGNGNGKHAPPEPATGKQLGFIKSLAKRHHIPRNDLDQIVVRVTGRRHLGDGLSKKDAHELIEELQQQPV